MRFLIMSILLGTLVAVSSENATGDMYSKAQRVCKETLARCQTGADGVEGNPHTRTTYGGVLGCDYSKEKGVISMEEWFQCSRWCQAEYKECSAVVEDQRNGG